MKGMFDCLMDGVFKHRQIMSPHLVTEKKRLPCWCFFGNSLRSVRIPPSTNQDAKKSKRIVSFLLLAQLAQND